MILDGQRQWRLLGVVSFGAKCAQPELPGVYAWANARAVRPFIDAEAAKDATPAGSGVVAPTPGAPPTAPPADDRRAPRVGTIRLGLSGRSLVVRFNLSEGALLTTTLFRGGREVRGPLYDAAPKGATAIRIKGRPRPGRYRLVVSAVDGALNRSGRAVRFHVSG